MDNEDPKPLMTYFIEEKYVSDINISFKKIGTVTEHIHYNLILHQSIKRDIWIIKSDYNSDRNNKINAFESNDDFKNSILILDLTTEDEINYQIYNSYQHTEYNFMNDVVSCIKDYNDGLPNRSRYQRTDFGMCSEWIEHNKIYKLLSNKLLEYLPYIGETIDEVTESAKHVDLDENANGTPMEWFSGTK